MSEIRHIFVFLTGLRQTMGGQGDAQEGTARGGALQRRVRHDRATQRVRGRARGMGSRADVCGSLGLVVVTGRVAERGSELCDARRGHATQAATDARHLQAESQS